MMDKAIIIYSTRTGNTEIMAVAIQVGLKEAAVQVTSKNVEKAKLSDLKNADALPIIMTCCPP
jgi:flavodoxin